MKKTILFSTLALSLFTMSCNKETVTQDMEDTVYSMYPKATDLEWDIERKYTTAEFIVDGVEIEMRFEKGRWTRIETDINKDDIPQAVKDSFAKGEYKDWYITDADEVKTPPNNITYVLDVMDGKKEYDLTYSAEGKLLSAKKDW